MTGRAFALLLLATSCARLPFRPGLPAAAPPTALLACADPAPDDVAASLGRGVTLSGDDARRLFPGAGLDRVLVAAVEVQARSATACDGWLVARDVRLRLRGPQGVPVEAGVATRVPPGPILAVSSDDDAPAPPADAWRVAGRYELRREGAVVLGRVR